jgi:organic hydroperoxide reductase OsmC/OhrA
MPRQHHFIATIQWTGNQGTGTDHYTHYERSHQISIPGKPDLSASSAAAFRGDASLHNPEDLLVASISSCHMLWYLHLCADAGVIVTAYTDEATGVLTQTASGGGQFTEVTLHPNVTVQETSMIEKANELHHKAHEFCFIANSVNFPVKVESTASTQ